MTRGGKFIIDAGATSGCNWYWCHVKGESVERWHPDLKCAVIYHSINDAEKALLAIRSFSTYEAQSRRFHIVEGKIKCLNHQ